MFNLLADQREEMSEPYLDELATEEGSPIDSLQSTINSLSKKAQSFNKESEEADAAVDEIAGTLTQWNMDFVKLKSNEHAVLTDRIASSTGIVGSFLSLADIILPSENIATFAWKYLQPKSVACPSRG